MSAHEQFAEDLALYALDALAGEDRVNLEKHLVTCPDCRIELEQLRGDGALLALSVTGPKPPVRARQRLLDAGAKESSAAPTLAQKMRKDGAPAKETATRRSWWPWLGWAAAAAVLVFAASLWKENSVLKEGLASANTQAAGPARGLED